MEATGSSDRLRWLVSIAAIGLTVFLAYVLWRGRLDSSPAALLSDAEAPITLSTVEPPKPTQIGVDVVGAVQQPGLYYLTPDARVDDAVKAAGGLAPQADRDAVNLAARVKDEQQLRIPRVGEADLRTIASDVTTAGQQARIDLNTADAAALEALPGIGPAGAKEIVAYRAAHGPFRSVEQLDDVSGIGPTTVDALRDLVIVNEASGSR